jgi:hypothetical protein
MLRHRTAPSLPARILRLDLRADAPIIGARSIQIKLWASPIDHLSTARARYGRGYSFF